MSIIQTLGRLDGGFFIGRATDAEQELVRSIVETGKAGSLTITLSIKPATRGGAMVIRGDVKLKKPAEAPTETMMFATEDGELLVDDPKQMRLDLQVIPEATADHVNQKLRTV